MAQVAGRLRWSLVVVCVGWAGCAQPTDTSGRVEVSLKTDMLAAEDFVRVVSELRGADGGALRTETEDALPSMPFATGMLVATFDGVPGGVHTIRVKLLDAGGRLVAFQDRTVQVSRVLSTTFVIGKASCDDITCPGDEQCLNGQCIAASCLTDPGSEDCAPPRPGPGFGSGGDGGTGPGTGAICGDGTCEDAEESCTTCETDCGECELEQPPECTAGQTKACAITNAAGSCNGVQGCVAGSWGPCAASTPSAEICDTQDNNCNGATDEGLDCSHPVMCKILWSNKTVKYDYTPVMHAVGAWPGAYYGIVQCTAGNEYDQGNCGDLVGQCAALTHNAGHAHPVNFKLFDDAYANEVEVVDFRIQDSFRVCGTTPEGAEVCRKFFGRPVVKPVNGHIHDAQCITFSDGELNPSPPWDAITWRFQDQTIIPTLGVDDPRRWWGRCHTVNTFPYQEPVQAASGP